MSELPHSVPISVLAPKFYCYGGILDKGEYRELYVSEELYWDGMSSIEILHQMKRYQPQELYAYKNKMFFIELTLK